MKGAKINPNLMTVIIGIILIGLISSIPFQKENYSFAETIVEVKIPEGASEENSDHFDPATATVAKGTTVEWINDVSIFLLSIIRYHVI